jgi:(p)ppGpp synthase/HD superfamily hydrolase
MNGKTDHETSQLITAITDAFKTNRNAGAGQLLRAIDLAIQLHGDQTPRPDGPYVHHVLRVAGRVVNDFGVKDTDVVIAVLLHDSLEDQYVKLSLLFDAGAAPTLENAKKYLRELFGDKVLHIVSAVTNPHEWDGLDANERNSRYLAHVSEMISDPDVFYVKLSDFSDNGLNIGNLTDKRKQYNLAQKYMPLYGLFAERLSNSDIAIDQSKKKEIVNRLMAAKEFAEKLHYSS